MIQEIRPNQKTGHVSQGEIGEEWVKRELEHEGWTVIKSKVTKLSDNLNYILKTNTWGLRQLNREQAIKISNDLIGLKNAPDFVCEKNNIIKFIEVKTISETDRMYIEKVKQKRTMEFLANKGYSVSVIFLSCYLDQINKNIGVFKELAFVDDRWIPVSTLKRLDYHERIKEKHPNAYQKWRPDEDASLKKFYKEGKSLRKLTELFQRQYDGIRARLHKFGLADLPNYLQNDKNPNKKLM